MANRQIDLMQPNSAHELGSLISINEQNQIASWEMLLDILTIIGQQTPDVLDSGHQNVSGFCCLFTKSYDEIIETIKDRPSKYSFTKGHLVNIHDLLVDCEVISNYDDNNIDPLFLTALSHRKLHDDLLNEIFDLENFDRFSNIIKEYATFNASKVIANLAAGNSIGPQLAAARKTMIFDLELQ